jgi:hypothetical protein
MAGLAAGYSRNHQLRQMVGQQQVWTQLEAFARQIHNSLNPTEVAYLIANESRRLIECDRISVGIRMGSKTRVEAISGADVVERRSNLVVLMRKLFDAVLKWGEKLVYNGTKDDTLPPTVLSALDDYLAESTSKLLVILPLRDDRETNKKRPPRTALMMEAFDPSLSSDQMMARLEVIGKHATAALYNATEYKRIPFRFVWLPLAKVQDGLGGKAKAITTCVIAAVAIVVALLVFVPYPLKLEAKGQLMPIKRAQVFPPVVGNDANPGFCTVIDFPEVIKPGVRVVKGQELVHLYAPDLQPQVTKISADIESSQRQVDLAEEVIHNQTSADIGKLLQIQMNAFSAKTDLKSNKAKLNQLRELYNIDPLKPGYLSLRAPIDGVILTPNFRETFKGATVKENTPILRIGYYNPEPGKNKISDWEIELKIPQKHIGQVLEAFGRLKAGEDLDVDILLKSEPTRMYKGKLARNKVAAEATPNRDENNESDPVTFAWVRVHGKDIPADYQIPADKLVADLAVTTKVRCGNRPMGYSLFYGIGEWVFEKIVFFF